MRADYERDELDDFVEEQIKDPDFKQALDDASRRADLRRHLVSARSSLKMSQADVAKCMGTTQSAISEFENGATDPHFSTLQRYARAVCGEIRVSFMPAHVKPVEFVLRNGWTSGETSAAVIEVRTVSSHSTSLIGIAIESNDNALAR